MKNIANIKVGMSDTNPSESSHTWGVRQGNRPHSILGDVGARHGGHKGATRPRGKATVTRSTGINAERRQPIDPTSPNLPPA